MQIPPCFNPILLALSFVVCYWDLEEFARDILNISIAKRTTYQVNSLMRCKELSLQFTNVQYRASDLEQFVLKWTNTVALIFKPAFQ